MINKILKFLIFDKFYISQQRDVLIFDEKSSNFLSKFFENNQFNFFFTRKEKFEIYVFFLTFLKHGTKNFGKNYFFNYIKVYKPKYIFSMWVLNEYLFFVKNFFPNIKIILVQGHRFNIDHFQKMNTYPKNSFDLLFTFSKNEKKSLKKNFNEDLIIPIGSAKNNQYHKQEIKKKKILLLS